MGKHDTTGHTLHTPKKMKFVQPKPAALTDQTARLAQMPRPGHSSHNLIK